MGLVHANSVDAAREALAGAPSPVIVIPVYNGHEDVVRCYESVLTHTPTDLAVLVVDDCGHDRRPVEILDELAPRLAHLVVVLHRGENGGFTAGANDAFASTPGRDVILLNSDVVVGAEWATRLTAVANSSSLVGTVSTLTNHGTILSTPVRNRPDDRLPDGISPDDAATRIAKYSLQLRPTIPTAVGHCVYIKRAVIDLIGGFDPAFGTGYGEEVDFSQRALMMGFRNVCADDVFTYHRGGSSFGEAAKPQQHANEDLVNARYPWYAPMVARAAADRFSPLARALDRARFALGGSVIAIDATSLGGFWAGTQTVVLETIRALSPLLDDARLRVYHTPALTPEVADIIDDLGNVERVNIWSPVSGALGRADVLYRPCQVNSLDELRWLREHGQRVIVNQLDIIAWSNPSYFPSDRQWLDYRELTRLVLAAVDGVAFISDFVRREVAAENLIPDGTPTRVVYCGTTSAFDDRDVSSSQPSTFDDDGRPFLFVLGASYHHKNRAFAIQVLEEMRARGWDGRLVLAGPTPPRGTSLGEEAEALLRNPPLKPHVIQLGNLSEAEKQYMYSRAALTLYPTVSEGFGLVPFESARRRVPVLSSRQGSLDEVLPRDLLTLDTYDVRHAAELALRLVSDPSAARAVCDAINVRAQEFTWEATAAEALALIEEVLTHAPHRLAAAWGEADAPAVLDAGSGAFHAQAGGVQVERVIQRLLRAEGAKRAVVPAGSRRQSVARRTANWARRQSAPG